MRFILKTLVFCIMLPPALLAFFTGAAVAGFIEGWKRSPIGPFFE